MNLPGQMLKQALSSALGKPATQMYPFTKLDAFEKYRGKLTFNSVECTGCKLCMRDCPSGAIVINKVADRRYECVVNFEKCIYCGQCEEVCPKKGALSLTGEIELAQLDKSKLRSLLSMPGLNRELKLRLKGATKVAVLGVGSVLKSDDAVGVLVALKIGNRRKTKDSPLIRSYNGSTAPENFAGVIAKFNPSHLIVVDAADLNAKPGKTAVIPPENIEGASFSTHMLPLRLTVDYIRASIPCAVIVIGIQPKSLAFGETRSKPVLAAVDAVCGGILKGVSGAK